jgi:hypothetical protein
MMIVEGRKALDSDVMTANMTTANQSIREEYISRDPIIPSIPVGPCVLRDADSHVRCKEDIAQGRIKFVLSAAPLHH